MVRSLYSGVAGLTVHQTRMDVIGNNIANVNTYGFKASRTCFADIYYQQKKSSAEGNASFAGNNEAAVGLGVQIMSIDKDMSASSFQNTNRTLDLAISGDGFYMVGTVDDLVQVDSISYTRYGNFGIDSDGNLVNTENLFVLGTVNDGKFTSTELNGKVPAENPADLDTINVNELVWDAFRDYTEIKWNEVPQKTKDPGYVTEIINPLDKTQTIIAAFPSADTSGAGSKEGRTDPQGITKADNGTLSGDSAADGAGNGYEVLYNVNGRYVNGNGIVYDTDSGYYVDNYGDKYTYYKTRKSEISDEEFDPTNPDHFNHIYYNTRTGVNYQYNPVTRNYEGYDAPNQTPGTMPAGGNALFADMQVGALKYSDLDAFSVGANGVMTATLGGEIKALARIELSTFDNAEGLEQIGNTNFAESAASGKPIVKKPGTNGTGTIQSSRLEMSNVNLASEFSDMIVTQRGFQANARIITTSDTMLEELVNLKR